MARSPGRWNELSQPLERAANEMEIDPRRTVRLHRLSRFLSLLLRHRPARFPIKLDEQGYAELRDVMAMLQKLPNLRWATRADIQAVVDLPGRQRFEIVESKIRALYGHTAVRPSYEAVAPPEVLYYGGSEECLDSIRREGIQPHEHSYVHLATTPEGARSMALRSTPDPVVVKIDARGAHMRGEPFYHPVDGIFLCGEIAPADIGDRVTVSAPTPDIPDEE